MQQGETEGHTISTTAKVQVLTKKKKLVYRHLKMFAEHPWNYLLKLFRIIYLINISFNWQMSENLVSWNGTEKNTISHGAMSSFFIKLINFGTSTAHATRLKSVYSLTMDSLNSTWAILGTSSQKQLSNMLKHIDPL